MSKEDSDEYYTKEEITQIGIYIVFGTLLILGVGWIIQYWADNVDNFGTLNDAGVYLFFMLFILSIVVAVAGYMILQVMWFLGNVLLYYGLNILLGQSQRQS